VCGGGGGGGGDTCMGFIELFASGWTFFSNSPCTFPCGMKWKTSEYLFVVVSTA